VYKEAPGFRPGPRDDVASMVCLALGDGLFGGGRAGMGAVGGGGVGGGAHGGVSSAAKKASDGRLLATVVYLMRVSAFIHAAVMAAFLNLRGVACHVTHSRLTPVCRIQLASYDATRFM